MDGWEIRKTKQKENDSFIITVRSACAQLIVTPSERHQIDDNANDLNKNNNGKEMGYKARNSKKGTTSDGLPDIPLFTSTLPTNKSFEM